MNRRKFIKQSVIGGLGVGLATGLYAWQIEPFWPEFVKHKMPIANLPNHLIGKLLVQISDMHIGNRFDYDYIIDTFKEVQKLNPDYVVYTGDFVSYEDKKQLVQLDEVLQYAVNGSLGTVGVLGNHDYGYKWSDKNIASQITTQLNKAGINILRNEQTELSGLNIIGIDDYWGSNFYPEKALNGYNSEKANLVLCHNPDVCDLDVWQDYQGWILSGHTHGGQCKPPFLPAPILPVKNKNYSEGIIDLNDGRTLYINRAIGHLWQVRFNVRPEITIFEIDKA